MTVVLPKTKAEQDLVVHYEAVADRLPGGTATRAARKAAIGAFAAMGLPHRRIEEWKYTDLRAAIKEAFPPAPHELSADSSSLLAALRQSPSNKHLADLNAVRVIFLDGRHLHTEACAGVEIGRDVHIQPVTTILTQPGHAWLEEVMAAVARHRNPMLELNTAFLTDGTTMRIAPDVTLTAPIHLVFVSSGASKASLATRNFIKVDARARATIIESHVALGAAAVQTNAVTQIHVSEGARVDHLKTYSAGSTDLHTGAWLADVDAEADYRVLQLTAGGGIVRSELFVTFQGSGASADLSGVMLGRGRDHIDTTLVADHAVPGCTSRELFKSVLDGHARAVFQGKLIVRPDAQKTDAKQMAQALLLSEDAEFDSKPELEIFADDVACGHGSTSGELDDDLLFYLRSRGIPEQPARALLITAFIGEALAKIENEEICAALTATAEHWLTRAQP